MNFLKIKLIIVFAAFAIFINACTPEPVAPPVEGNEEEVITTMTLTLTDSADASNVVTATFRDADGDGGNPPTIDTLVLKANTTYFTTVTLLDETKSPASNISEEVAEEANDHQLFYKLFDISIAIFYADQDTNNPPLPLGLKTVWHTGNAGNGSVQVILKHQPGTKSNSMSTGETDIDIIYQTVLE